MAEPRWLGRAGAVADVNTVTIANTWATGDTVTVTINGKALTVTIGTLVTTAQVATTLKEAFEGETFTDTTASVVPAGGGPDFSEHSEMTATVSGSVVTLTGDDPGKPWSSGMAASEVTAGDGTATLANATAATGPNHADNVLNWSGGALPTTGDNAWLDNSSVSILYGLDGIAGNTLASFNVARSYTGDIGLPKTNASGYPEFRDDYLEIDASSLNIGYGDGQGSSRVKIDSGSVAVALIVETTGSAAESGLGAFIWKGTGATNSLRVMTGSVSVCIFNGETSILASIRAAAGTLECGSGLTGAAAADITIVTNQGATIAIRSNVDTIEQTAGQITLLDAMTVDDLTLESGIAIHKSSGTIDALTIGGPDGATLDCTQDNSPRTITECTVKDGFLIDDPLSTITYTNNVAVECARLGG